MSLGAALVGGLLGLKQSNDQSKLAKQTLAQQQAQYGQLSSAAQPYLDTAQGALDNLKNPGASFTTSPGYNFRVNQATQGALGSVALNGLLNSGSALKAYNNYVGGTASNEYNNWYGQQLSTANLGTQGLNALSGAISGNSQAINNYAADKNTANTTFNNTLGTAAGSLFSNPTIQNAGNALYTAFKNKLAGSSPAAPASSYNYFAQPAYSL